MARQGAHTGVCVNGEVLLALLLLLTSLLRTVVEQPTAGIVGPLFIGSGYKIMEAGGIVWSDATAGMASAASRC